MSAKEMDKNTAQSVGQNVVAKQAAVNRVKEVERNGRQAAYGRRSKASFHMFDCGVQACAPSQMYKPERFRNKVNTPRVGYDGFCCSRKFDSKKSGALKFGCNELRKAHNGSAADYAGRRQVHNSAVVYTSDRFLLANCQFVVSAACDCSANLFDPDQTVEWDKVEEVHLVDKAVPMCPICLYPPVAAKISKCGHVFCWPCILHYLALSDQKWRKCPICFDSIYGDQLKSVKATQVDGYAVGDRVNMVLMCCKKGMTTTIPKSKWPGYRGGILSSSDECGRFSKIVSISSTETMSSIVERERTELLAKLASDTDEPEAIFVEQALKSLKCREEHLFGAAPAKDVSAAEAEEHVEIRDRSKSDLASCSREVTDAPSVLEQHGPYLGSDQQSKQLCFFYQADDGQNVYLHPINARCLIQQYGSIELSPDHVSGRIVEIDTYLMDDVCRQKFRHLAHLPRNTTFYVVELQFDDGILSPEILSRFSVDFEKREATRQQKADAEKRLELRAQKWERAVMHDPRNFGKYNCFSTVEIPTWTFVPSAQPSIDFPTPSGTGSSAAADATTPADDHLGAKNSAGMVSSHFSFAQALKQKKPGDIAVHASSSPALPTDNSQLEDISIPLYQDSFAKALSEAFDNFAIEATTEEPSTSSSATTRSNKKGKSKKRVIFST